MIPNKNTRIRLSYTATNPDTNNTIMDLDLSFEDANYQTLMDNLNTWLTAAGYALVVKPKYESNLKPAQVAAPAEAYYKNSVQERTN